MDEVKTCSLEQRKLDFTTTGEQNAMTGRISIQVGLCLFFTSLPAAATEVGQGSVYQVIELVFSGPTQEPTDTPAKNIEFWARFAHEDGDSHKVHGFWDGDRQGGTSGNVFKIRFCPTKPGQWSMTEVHSNNAQLNGQRQGESLTVAQSRHPGFWLVDQEHAGGRWYQRSDGSHPYIFGNTHYTCLTGFGPDGKPTGHQIQADIAGNADYFKKLRFAVCGDRYPDPRVKPFLDEAGRPSDDGLHSPRPNPAWFQRVDTAVQAAFEHDLIADLILCGPDTRESRGTLAPRDQQATVEPYLRYIAARYGSYPNVWMCLCNEFDIKKPKYDESQIAAAGSQLRKLLPYPTPLSVHGSQRVAWSSRFYDLPPWNDHHIIQRKLRNLGPAADAVAAVGSKASGKARRAKPTIDDELSYQGAGDKHSELDTIESHLGAFLGGGYATTGEKRGSKLGQYFWGGFDPRVHTAADNLQFLRRVIDGEIRFWRMSPGTKIFSNLHSGFRGLAWDGHEYVLGTNRSHEAIVASLPPGEWTIRRHDCVAKESQTLAERATGRFEFNAPDCRAVLFHFRKRESP